MTSMNKAPMQFGLPLSGGGPTLDGYPTVFVKGRPESPDADRAKSAIRVLTKKRIDWLMLLHKGPHAWPRKRGKVQDDCQALGWTEWARDDNGDYLYDTNSASPRVMERLTTRGREAIDHLIPGRRIDARGKKAA